MLGRDCRNELVFADWCTSFFVRFGRSAQEGFWLGILDSKSLLWRFALAEV